MSKKNEVLNFLQILPRNKVITYKALAEKFGTHPRAIGVYMRTNKEFDTYPCYKVVAHDGGLGGYILGVEEKRKRLVRDGVIFVGNCVGEEYILRVV